jgi:hypothetical protein
MTDRYEEGREQALKDAETQDIGDMILDWEERPHIDADYELGYWKGIKAALRDRRAKRAANALERGNGLQGDWKGNVHFLTFHGERMSAGAWAEELGIKLNTINCRIARGWTDVAKILSRPAPDGRTTRTTGWLKKRKRAKKPVDRKRRGAVMSDRGKRVLTPPPPPPVAKEQHTDDQ